jgi:hypothetical protein
VTFKSDYDVFNGATLKFITDFDFVHIDISFTGNTENNICDLIMLLEENNIAYSIRINSISIDNYTMELTKRLPSFRHRIAYSVSTPLKPYQIYLIGTPSPQTKSWKGPMMKDSLIFKSMALAFSGLLSPSCRLHRLHEFAPNSISIYLPRVHDQDNFIQKICNDSIQEEQLYYLRRYLAEIGMDKYLEFSYDCLNDRGKNLVSSFTRMFHVSDQTTYSKMQYDQIGDVKDTIRHHHEHHIDCMNERTTAIWKADILKCDDSVLTYFRTYHPLREVRTWCNIVLGLGKFCRSSLLSGHHQLESDYRTLIGKHDSKLSVHQREIYLAVKLLVLACRDDNYAYGVNYCHKLFLAKNTAGIRASRLLRIYRLISYLFDDIHQMMSRGLICIRSINAIANELEVRESTRYRNRIVNPDKPDIPIETQSLDHIITDSIDELFKGLELYASRITDEAPATEQSTSFDQTMEGMNLNFDIGIQERVEYMIEKLQLKPSGPFGTIDLGDDDIIEYDDW